MAPTVGRTRPHMVEVGLSMQVERFRSLVTAAGPFASLYFDDSRDTADAVEQLQNRWRDIHAHFARLGADENVVAALERDVVLQKPPVGRRGRVVIAAGDQILVDESLASPPPSTVARWSDYPYLLPLAALEMVWPTYVFPLSTTRVPMSPCTTAASSSPRLSTAEAIPCTRRSRPAGAGTATSSGRPRKPSG